MDTSKEEKSKMRLHRCEGCLAACPPRRAPSATPVPRALVKGSLCKRARRSPYPAKQSCAKMADPAPPTPPDNNAPPMPWFGMDIGGTLTKLVYFEPRETNRRELDKETEVLKNIRRYLTRNSAYGNTGRRDVHLQMDNVSLRGRRGTLHFIRFPTTEVGAFLQLARSKGMAALVNTIYATGGGAYKFEENFIKLDALIAGLLFVDAWHPAECYYWAPPEPQALHSTSDTMCTADRRAKVSREDLARATLVTITNNIGSIARLCASNQKIERVVFCGNFLRVNPLSMKLLSYAMSYWSRGALKALFLEHEGYFGAVGCLLELDDKNHRKENVSRHATPHAEPRQADR
ncbi:hypothetical protein MSG28_014574 [Choristoneura fumiferana]|uniref:Uncharacterized protein n=1 Tax=Choristoneura fumiferana TaxID=7141 RepID=A0ACC0JRX5_CHOFU|nr:hypothetical protein MSG28_014574 [Choristoneura fumiferana]